MKYKLIDGEGVEYIGSVVMRYTDYAGEKPLDVVIIKLDDTNELVHLSCTCLVAIV